MSDSLIAQFALILLCFVLSAFFSMTETALTSLSSLKTKHMRENSGAAGHVLELWLHSPQKVLAAILIGNNLVNIFAAVYADNLVQKAFGFSSVELVTTLMTLLIVLFTEVIPKTLGKNYSSQLAIPSLQLFRIFYVLFTPFTWLISGAASAFLSLFKPSEKSSRSSPQITEEELEFLINVGEEEGVIAEQKHEMLSGIFELGDTIAREIMVPRMDMMALSADTGLLEAVQTFKSTGLSRLPIYEKRLDNIVGVIHSKDLLFRLQKQIESPDLAEEKIMDFKRPALFVPESKPVDLLFQELRKQRQHMAICLDEYGGTSGLVTLEDIFEEIVGEIRDEFDDEEDAIRPSSLPNQYIVECKVHIDDFAEFFDISEQVVFQNNESSEYDTLGGFILHHFGEIPKLSDKITIGSVVIEVIEVSKRRVRKVLVKVTDSGTSVRPQATKPPSSIAPRSKVPGSKTHGSNVPGSNPPHAIGHSTEESSEKKPGVST